MDAIKRKIRIGTRGSNLALAQANLVIQALMETEPELECELIIIHTEGDKILNKPLLEFGGKGVFVNEFEEALLRDEIDIAVHSAKDMPMELMEGLDIIGVLKREDPRDVLITMKDTAIDEKKHAVIGTSSLRRQLQIEGLIKNITCDSLRGNVNTRLKKLADGMYDGIILAAAGIKRLALDKEPIYEYRYFDVSEITPAGGQAIIAIEGKKDSIVQERINPISDYAASIELDLERSVLNYFSAGCHEPIGVFTKVSGNNVAIWMMKEQNGKVVKKTGSTTIDHRYQFIYSMADRIMEEL